MIEQQFSPHRGLTIAGLVLILLTMVLGFVYASYISHVANGGIKQAWAAVMEAVSLSDIEVVKEQFAIIADLTEKRGRIMNGHSHLGGVGLLALVIALLLPLSSLAQRVRDFVAILIVAGALLQFVGVVFGYLLNMQGLLYFSDIGSLVLSVGVVVVVYGLLKREGSNRFALSDVASSCITSDSSRMLLQGGVLLLLICMMTGIYIAWLLVDRDQPGMLNALTASVVNLMQQDVTAAQQAIANFKSFQSKMAINAAAHSHGLEMGFVILLLALNRNQIAINEQYFKWWSILFLLVSFCFPVFIYLAINYWFGFAKFANYSGVTLGVLLLIALFGMMKGGGMVDLKQPDSEVDNG